MNLPTMYAHGKEVVVMYLDAPAVDFLLSYLPEDDGFTAELRALREQAKEIVWARQ